MWRFLTGIKPPPQRKAKLSETDMVDSMVRERKEKTKMDGFF